MKKATIEAMEKVCDGLLDLLESLKAEQSLRIEYPALQLGKAVRELRRELGQEDVQ